MQDLTPELKRALDQLRLFGFDVRWRQEEWWNCAVLGHGSAVIGHGVDRGAALDHALAQMLAHPLARALWQRQLGADLSEKAAAPQVLAEPASAGPGEEPQAADQAPLQRAPSPPDDVPVAADLDPAQPILDPAQPDLHPAQPGEPPELAGEPATPPSKAPALAAVQEVEPAAPSAKRRQESLPRIDVALLALHELEQDIDETTDFPLLAAEVMRLQLVAWIAVARDWQDRLGDDEVTQRVRGIAARLGSLARRYWPGQVPALRLDARPDDTRALVGGEPHSWADVAELAQAAMARATAEDEYGWADSAKLGPQPRDPRSRLGEAQAILRRLLPGVDEPGSAAANQRVALLRQDLPINDLGTVARMLRWLRLSADPEPWGRAMGLLRWLAQRLAPGLPPALEKLLLAETLPARDWARENGFSPQRGEQRKALAELPPPQAGEEPLKTWFSAVYKLCNAETLAARLAAHRELLLGLDAQQAFPGDGTARDRWRKVQKRLAAQGEAAPVPQPVAVVEEAEVADPEEAGPVAKARLLVNGSKALVLGNRADPHLERHLREGLGFEQLDWCLTDNGSGLEAASKRVRNRGYRVVLGLTSFISHPSESVLRQACSSGGVPFVRAGKGRLVGCALAILRDWPAQAESPAK